MRLVNLDGPIIVLVRPQLAENIGMVARAMMNCGLSCLRVVNPREDIMDPKAVSASSGAAAVLENAKVYRSLDAALSDVHFVLATTARERDMAKSLMTPGIAIKGTAQSLNKKEKVAWVFGPERTGLENVDLALSDGLVQIPLNPLHSSLNLSQAVLIMGYLWWTREQKEKNVLFGGGAKSATKQELSVFLNRLDALLQTNGYYSLKEKEERMRRNLHNIFERIGLTNSELKTLYNVLSALEKKK